MIELENVYCIALESWSSAASDWFVDVNVYDAKSAWRRY